MCSFLCLGSSSPFKPLFSVSRAPDLFLSRKRGPASISGLGRKYPPDEAPHLQNKSPTTMVPSPKQALKYPVLGAFTSGPHLPTWRAPPTSIDCSANQTPQVSARPLPVRISRVSFLTFYSCNSVQRNIYILNARFSATSGQNLNSIFTKTDLYCPFKQTSIPLIQPVCKNHCECSAHPASKWRVSFLECKNDSLI